MQRRARPEAAGANHLDLLRSPTQLPRLPAAAFETCQRKPIRDNSPALRTPPPLQVQVQVQIPPKPPRLRRNQTLRGPSPDHFGSEELLRSSSTTNLTVRQRPHTQHESPGGRGGPLTQSQSCDHMPLQPTTLDEACRNISNSNRSLVDTLTREVAGIRGTVPLSVQRLPGNRHDVPVYLIGDDPVESSPTLLQRSKTFIIERAASVRKSFRSRSNSSINRSPAATETSSAKTASNAKTEQQTGRISLVFGVHNREGAASVPKCPQRPPRRKNSFKEFRKRLFSR